jgi:WD40 repeat protein
MRARRLCCWVAGLLLAVGVASWYDRAVARVAPPGREGVCLDLYGDPLPPGAVARLGSVRLLDRFAGRGMAFLPGGKKLVSHGGGDLRVWDAQTGQEDRQHSQKLKGLGEAFAFTATRHVARVDRHDVVTVQDLVTGQVLARFRVALGHHPWPNCPGALSLGGKVLALAYKDKTIRLYDARTGQPTETLRGHKEPVGVLSFSPDGSVLASGEFDDNYTSFPDDKPYGVYLWDMRTRKRLPARPEHARGIRSIAFSRDGKMLAVTGLSPQVGLWATETGKSLGRLGTPQEFFGSLAFTPDGSSLLALHDGQIDIWDLTSRRPVGRFPGARGGSPLVVSPNGKMVVAQSEDDISIGRWDLERRQEIPIPGHQGAIGLIQLLPDGRRVTTVCRDATVRTWNLFSGKELSRVKVPKGSLESIALTPDGKEAIAQVLRGRPEPPPYLRLHSWDLATGQMRTIAPAMSLPGYRGIVSPNGTIYALATKEGPQFWDLITGKELRVHRSPEPVGRILTFSPDGMRLAAGDRIYTWRRPRAQSIQVWDMQSGAIQAKLSTENPVIESLSVSPDGQIVAAGQIEAVRLWDVRSKRIVRTFTGHRKGDPVYRIVFSPDGKVIASAAGLPWHCQVHYWEAATGQEIATPFGHLSDSRALAFSPDGKYILAGSEGRTVLVWDLTNLPGFSEGRHARPLTLGELEQAWTDLGSPDARTGYRTICRLVRSPREGVAFFAKRFLPSPRRDVERIRRLVVELDSDTFLLRRQAATALAALGESARPELEEAVARSSSAEVRKAARQLLEGFALSANR